MSPVEEAELLKRATSLARAEMPVYEMRRKVLGVVTRPTDRAVLRFVSEMGGVVERRHLELVTSRENDRKAIACLAEAGWVVRLGWGRATRLELTALGRSAVESLPRPARAASAPELTDRRRTSSSPRSSSTWTSSGGMPQGAACDCLERVFGVSPP